jgi:hypothetical protein
VLAEEARRAIASVEFAIAEARQVGLGERPLRVGCLLYLPTSRLEQFLGELKQHNGKLRTEVMHLLEREQVDRLRSGALDLGVLVRSQEYSDLEYEPLFPSGPMVALLPSDHRLVEKEVLTPADLAPESLVFFPRSANPVLYDRFLVMFGDAGFRFVERYEGSADPRDILRAFTCASQSRELVSCPAPDQGRPAGCVCVVSGSEYRIANMVPIRDPSIDRHHSSLYSTYWRAYNCDHQSL